MINKGKGEQVSRTNLWGREKSERERERENDDVARVVRALSSLSSFGDTTC